jgi:prephenate dehydrogenase
MEDDFSLRDSTIGIVGLGLMGGSLAMSLKGKCARIIGFESHLPTIESALSLGIVDQASAFPSPFQGEGLGVRVNVLILATPVPSILTLLDQLRTVNYQLPITILDLGSTKREITEAMSDLPANFDPIGGHPICGKEKLGLENAHADLYKDAPFIVTPLERTTTRARRITRELIAAIGARPVEMTAEKHDRVFASTSHLPFLIASSLSRSTPHDFSPFIGPGFLSTSRLAATPSGMMMGILKSNRDNVLEAIRSFQTSLKEIESALEGEAYAELEDLLDQSRSNHQSITAKETGRLVDKSPVSNL